MTKIVCYFLLRNKVKYEIFILLVIGLYTSYHVDANQYAVTFSITVLSILYTLYFHVLVRHNGRINLLYKGSTVKKLKLDLVKSIFILSGFFLIFAIAVDLLLLNRFYLIVYYVVTMVSFSVSTVFMPINIEKREKHTTEVVTIKDGLRIISFGAGTCLLLLLLVSLV